jgi:phosphatidylglycerophosphate synthase
MDGAVGGGHHRREIAVSALREWMAELGQRAKVKVASIGKIKTIVQMVALRLPALFRARCKLSDPRAVPFVIGDWMLAVAALLTLWSGLPTCARRGRPCGKTPAQAEGFPSGRTDA